MEPCVQRALTDYLGSFIAAPRRARIEGVLAQRTRYLTLMLEDIYQSHNASAVLRSAECFGIQELHVVESRNVYQVNRDIALGASRWLDIVRYRDEGGSALESCWTALEGRGYRLVAATPDLSATPLDELDVEGGKLAVFLGTEEEGLTSEALGATVEAVSVPMFGFTESLNVSVCAALILRELTAAIRRSERIRWRLTASEKNEIRLAWYRRIVKGSNLLEKRFLDENSAIR